MLDLAAQALHVHVDQSGVAGVPVAPDLLEEHLTGEHLPGLAGQGDEVELERGEREPLVATGHREWPATSMARSPMVRRSGSGSSPRQKAGPHPDGSCGGA